MYEITVLADNEVAQPRPKGLRGEWGFAAAVDGILFDTGQTGVVAQNAGRLGLAFDFETIVLSHGHYDHTGGLREVLARLDDPDLYCHPSVWQSRYVDHDDDRDMIGIPFTRDRIADEATIVEHTEPVEVADGIYALGEIPREHEDAAVGVHETDDGLVEDPVLDDQALAIQGEDGVALLMGCGHAGLRNTIEHAERVVGDEVRYLAGGTHLVAYDEPAVRDLADWLDGRLELFAGTHCTGEQARRIFADRFPDAFESIGVGSTLEV